MKKIPNTTKGFGLIEIMVSVGIFALVATMGIVAILSMIDSGEKSQSLNAVMQNLNTALETMARTVRTGQHYACTEGGSGVPDGSGCVNTGNSILQFLPPGGADADRTVYKLESGQIKVKGPQDASYTPVTSSEVVVDDLKFYVINPSTTSAQPRVLMVMTGHVQTRTKNNVTFTLQTTMTQRVIN
jgi:prepilin-type N-terminal cleavage/methylation domain-containing protein